ncbi:MAG: hypothetical protein HBSAPP02_27610 [Phycisphaerae bacterium]|nr:MAG: DUF3987 domain-containing protein [Planctomycetia bacterium]GJQ27729.1 MAG: hypothetical protein HBSAPP02_27610 [Phycisphaerae bacterium]
MIDAPRVAPTIRRFLELLFQPGDVFEVRVPDCRERRDARYAFTCSGYFTFETMDAAVAGIVELDRSAIAPGIYVTINPVAPALLARAANRIKPRARETTQDKDILRRCWLLIDVDPGRPAGVSATEAELALAHTRARAITEYLASATWPVPILAMSGNGYHLLYHIDLPADDGGLVKGVLAALADRFSDDVVVVDRAVHNPARIVKVIGTVSRKGDELRGAAGQDDRPHRRSEFVEVPEQLVAVPEELLRAVANAKDGSDDAARANVAAPVANVGGDNGRFDCTPAGVRAWLEARRVTVKGERRNGDKTLLLLERCPINPEIVSNGGSDIAVMVGDDGMLAYCNKHNRGQAYTWHDLRRALDPEYEARAADDGSVDLSAFGVSAHDAPPASAGDTQPIDPGPLPEELLRIPGFVSEVMDFCLETAPYPNLALAFGGALALQAFLAGRKVRDPGDNRTNIYVLALAHSSAGKDAPRKLNTQIINAVGFARCLGERLASGEGVQDALFADPAMLVQTDEIDSMLQSINKSRDARHESMMSTLLTLYSSSNSVYPMRRKAGKEYPGVIDQPCLVIFGTAIPNHYYEALSERMLTNGFFARMLILEASQQRRGQESSIRELPPRITATAKWWAEYRPGAGNLAGCHPAPAIVEQTEDARRVLAETREEADAEYNKAQSAQDAVGTTVWGRVSEQARKLSLIYAVSENHVEPRIGVEAARWASRLVTHQVRRMLFMAAGHVAENPFHADCLRLLKKLREAPDHALPHHVLLKRMKTDAKSFRELIETLVQRGDVVIDAVATEGRTRTVYRLVGNEGEQA